MKFPMNQLTRVALLTALLTASGAALAGPERGQQARGSDAGSIDPGRHLAGAVKRLDLSDDQDAAIQAIFEDNREDLHANRIASRELKAEIQTVLQADGLDEETLAVLASREGELAEERVLLAGTMISDLLAELDDAQRAELQTMQSERQERRRERFGARRTED